jgi:alpha-1,6-mannosyltransferase
VKSVHLTNAYHASSGGIRGFYDALLRAAGVHNWHFRLVIPGEETRVDDLDPFARVYRIQAPRAAFFDRRYRLLMPQHTIAPGAPILQILRDEQPDLVEVCDKYTLCYLAGVLRKGWIAGVRRPVLVGLSCERMDDNVASYLGLGRIGQMLSSLYMRRVYLPQFDLHIANSRYTADELRRQAPNHARSVHVLPMGVDTDRFGPFRRNSAFRNVMQEQIGGSDSTRLLAYIGRLSPEKNLSLLVDTMEQLAREREDYRLIIAGDGPIASWLHDECSRRAPRVVHFRRHLDHEAVADLLANVDVFVHPNPREPFGIAPLEAMASGIPLVVPDSGGVTTYATDEVAWPAPPTGESFARRVREVFEDSHVRQRKITRALNVAKTYSWDAVSGRFFATYKQLIRLSTAVPLTIS